MLCTYLPSYAKKKKNLLSLDFTRFQVSKYCRLNYLRLKKILGELFCCSSKRGLCSTRGRRRRACVHVWEMLGRQVYTRYCVQCKYYCSGVPLVILILGVGSVGLPACLLRKGILTTHLTPAHLSHTLSHLSHRTPISTHDEPCLCFFVSEKAGGTLVSPTIRVYIYIPLPMYSMYIHYINTRVHPWYSTLCAPYMHPNQIPAPSTGSLLSQ